MFKIKVNGGPPRDLKVETGVYRDAAAAVPAILGIHVPIDVEIWVEALVDEYKPLHYRVRADRFGGLVVEHLIPQPS
jgi:hypothetical protein